MVLCFQGDMSPEGSFSLWQMFHRVSFAWSCLQWGVSYNGSVYSPKPQGVLRLGLTFGPRAVRSPQRLPLTARKVRLVFPLHVPAGQEMRGGRRPGAPESEPALLVLRIYRGQPVPCTALPGACRALRSVRRSESHTECQTASFHGCPARAFPLIVPQGQPSAAIASQGAPRPSRRSWLAQEPPLPSPLLAPKAELQPAPGHYQS